TRWKPKARLSIHSSSCAARRNCSLLFREFPCRRVPLAVFRDQIHLASQSIKSIALACRILESLAVEDRDSASRISDETGFLKRPGDFRDACAPGSKHLREVDLRKLKLTFSQPVVQHQQPPTAALVEWV